MLMRQPAAPSSAPTPLLKAVACGPRQQQGYLSAAVPSKTGRFVTGKNPHEFGCEVLKSDDGEGAFPHQRRYKRITGHDGSAHLYLGAGGKPQVSGDDADVFAEPIDPSFMEFNGGSLATVAGEEFIDLVGYLGRRAGDLKVLDFHSDDSFSGFMEGKDVYVTDVFACSVSYPLLSDFPHRRTG